MYIKKIGVVSLIGGLVLISVFCFSFPFVWPIAVGSALMIGVISLGGATSSILIGIGLHKMYKNFILKPEKDKNKQKIKEKAQEILEECKEDSEKISQLTEGLLAEREKFEKIKLKNQMLDSGTLTNEKITFTQQADSPLSQLNTLEETNNETKIVISETTPLNQVLKSDTLNNTEELNVFTNLPNFFISMFTEPKKDKAKSLTNVISEIDNVQVELEEKLEIFETAATELMREQNSVSVILTESNNIKSITQ